jgi:ribonuclease BN (tRNA processing enzyme)
MPRPDQACSSYLVKSGQAALLLDLGSGAASKLQQAIEYECLDAIVISHMHADHFFDLVPLRYSLKYGKTAHRRLPLWLPPGGRRALEALRVAASVDTPPDFFESLFAIEEYDPLEALQVKDARVQFRRTRHYVEGYAVRVESGDTSVTYSSDTAPCDGVVELARETMRFLCEAALGLGGEDGERGHSSAEEAGEMARRADAKRLVLTHYPAEPASALVDRARTRFAGPIAAAVDGMEIEL